MRNQAGRVLGGMHQKYGSSSVVVVVVAVVVVVVSDAD